MYIYTRNISNNITVRTLSIHVHDMTIKMEQIILHVGIVYTIQQWSSDTQLY